MSRIQLRGGLLAAGLAIVAVCCVIDLREEVTRAADTPAAKATPKSEKEALAPLNALIGGWRGVGRPKRSERKDLWSEEANWAWDFRDQQVAIRYAVDKTDRWLKSARISYDLPTHKYHVAAEFADGTHRNYVGDFRDNQLLVDSAPDDSGDIYRLAVTLLNEKRTLVTHSRRRGTSSLSVSLADVGYTRAGVRLAVEGAGQPTCIVTGGYGSIQVSYEGKTYYVCCTGCKQAFDDDPAGIIADAMARAAEAKK